MSAASLVANLAAYLLQTTLLLAVGLLLPALFRVRDPGVRLRYWQGLLLTALALPFFTMPTAAGRGSATAVTAVLASGMEAVVTPGPRPLSPWPWLLGLLAAVAVARVLWVLAGVLALGRLRRHACAFAPLPEVLGAASHQVEVHAEFRTSSQVRTPLTFGWRRPTILLPEGFGSLDGRAQRCIALHELLHVGRRDWLVILLEETLRSILWFHPALWLVLDRIALSREQAVDREVVRLTEERTAYMHTLAAMARTRHGAAAVAILPFFQRSHLLQRLALLTKEVSMSKLRLGLSVAGSLVVLLCAGVVATRAFPLLGRPGDVPPASAQVAPSTVVPPPAAKIYKMEGSGIAPPKLLTQVGAVYPDAAKQKGIEGRVVLGVVITDQGVPTQIKVLKSDNEIFNASAIEAVSQWRWESPKLNGTPVSVEWVISMNFRLS